jgi:hypothetical protein
MKMNLYWIIRTTNITIKNVISIYNLLSEEYPWILLKSFNIKWIIESLF